VQMQAFFVPVRTPAAIIKRLNHEIVRFLHSPAAEETFLNAGTEPVGSSLEEAAAAIKDDIVTWGCLIKHIDLRIN